MSGADIILEGEEKLMQFFKEAPEKIYRKPVSKALKAAAVPIRQAMSSSLPPSLKKMNKIIKIKSSRRGLVVSVGFTGGLGVYENRRGQMWDPYMLVYWHNYGTLSNRLASHKFKYPRRRKSAHWRGGIIPGGFVEEAFEGSREKARRQLEETWEREIMKMCDELGVK
ncbi:MAG TPA: hypothetical protein PK727_04640 [Bacteroidales bacterium]|jgi:hypothetical protein|nr:hypothetical protein [Bacteroidales bacterium]HOG56596.1 hypothetical protein [Bacteroidales bacterium]